MTDSPTLNDWSAPEPAVIEAIADSIGDPARVVATLVAVDGSAFRRPGAKMVLSTEGGGVGSITAGCLEDEVESLAREVRTTGEATTVRYDLSDDDTWGLGLGCNGVIDLLLEPVDDRFRSLIESYWEGHDTVVVTVIESDRTDLHIGDRLVATGPTMDEPLAELGTWPDHLVSALHDPVRTLYEQGHADAITIGDADEVRVFIDVVTPPAELLVFGGGHDVEPVVTMGRRLGYHVTNVRYRGGVVDREAATGADRLIRTAPARLLDELEIDLETYAVVMTHNYVDDRLTLETLLESPVPYIGIVGSADRFDRMLDDFDAEGRPITETELDRIYSPAGLDLGGGSPTEIAVSILTELMVVANARTPRHLRERRRPVHARPQLEP